MRILFVVNGFLRGGAEMQVWQLANALSAPGVSCQVLALRSIADPIVPDWNRVPTASIDGNQLYDLPAMLRLAGLIGEFAPDLIVAVNQRPLLYSEVAKSIAARKSKLICIFQTTREHLNHHRHQPTLSMREGSGRRDSLRSAKDRVLSRLYRPFFARTDALVYVSRNQQAAWQKVGYHSRRATVIYNGVDTRRFSPEVLAPLGERKRSELKLTPDDYVIGLSAEFRPEKNHSQLVEAVKALRERGIPAKALFVGDGPTAPAVARYASELGQSEHVILAGHQSDIRPFLAAFDVGALCSTAETFSLAALEILATGTPIVMTDTGGAAEMLRHGESGLLFPVGDTEALVHDLGILAEPQLRARMGNRAALDMKRRFDLSIMVECYANLFQELAAQPTIGDVDDAPYHKAP